MKTATLPECVDADATATAQAANPASIARRSRRADSSRASPKAGPHQRASASSTRPLTGPPDAARAQRRKQSPQPRARPGRKPGHRHRCQDAGPHGQRDETQPCRGQPASNDRTRTPATVAGQMANKRRPGPSGPTSGPGRPGPATPPPPDDDGRYHSVGCGKSK